MPTNGSPADFTTRGMRVSDMAKEKKWWSGPVSLQKEESVWPANQIDAEKSFRSNGNQEGSSKAGRSNGDWTMISFHEDYQ